MRADKRGIPLQVLVTGAIILTAIWLNTRIFDHVGSARRRS